MISQFLGELGYPAQQKQKKMHPPRLNIAKKTRINSRASGGRLQQQHVTIYG